VLHDLRIHHIQLALERRLDCSKAELIVGPERAIILSMLIKRLIFLGFIPVLSLLLLFLNA